MWLRNSWGPRLMQVLSHWVCGGARLPGDTGCTERRAVLDLHAWGGHSGGGRQTPKETRWACPAFKASLLPQVGSPTRQWLYVPTPCPTSRCQPDCPGQILCYARPHPAVEQRCLLSGESLAGARGESGGPGKVICSILWFL